MKISITRLVSTVILAASLQSCASTSSVANKITVESGEIPPDMKSEDFTLIGVLKERGSYDKYVKIAFANYTGKYVLATENEIKDKYNDTNQYRYIMDYERETASLTVVGSGKSQTVPGKRYFILDRKTDKEYKRKTWSSFYTKEMQAYLKAIEAVKN
ncbi:hypothetical protein A1704_23100 [Chryseobacterium cucumeris]|uniref:hypothetical protein n=1 Tax=Chryseobacterium cucumeris TaxID=1813611 RepID=UPI000788DCC7|nr:hypothetical protein [Chryseobacterium cucumeris]KYH06703.1 hypothetical protein A1704_23100 [Chryseobacterium cucumeris]